MLGSQLDIWDNLNQLRLEFPEYDNQVLSRIEQQKERADLLISGAVKIGDRVILEEGFAELFSACRDLFDLYDRYCVAERDRIPVEILGDILERPAALEVHAADNMRSAEILINEVSEADELDRTRSLYMMAYDLMQLSLLRKGRALRIYQDFPVIHSYRWDEDFTVMDGEPAGVIKVIEYEKDLQTAADSGLPHGDQIPSSGVAYIVQIAAHTDKIPEEKLNSIYRGDKIINMLREDNWYKYFFGPFPNFEEAEKVMKSVGISSSFIAAYLDGKRINVADAVKWESKGN